MVRAYGDLASQAGALGKPIVLESRLGFEPDFKSGFEVIKTSSENHTGQRW